MRVKCTKLTHLSPLLFDMINFPWEFNMSKFMLAAALVAAGLSSQAMAAGQPNVLELNVHDEITSAHLYLGGNQPMRYGNETIKGIGILQDKHYVQEDSELKSSVTSFGYGTYGYGTAQLYVGVSETEFKEYKRTGMDLRTKLRMPLSKRLYASIEIEARPEFLAFSSGTVDEAVVAAELELRLFKETSIAVEAEQAFYKINSDWIHTDTEVSIGLKLKF